MGWSVLFQRYPSIEQPKTTPSTVTVIYDATADIGELYKNRRYVVPLEQIPEHTKRIYCSRRCKLWEHQGVDYMGIVRAVLRNAAPVRKPWRLNHHSKKKLTGVFSAKKTYERKNWNIACSENGAVVTNTILYLYLNQIYFGSGAHGIEAASRVYFNKM